MAGKPPRRTKPNVTAMARDFERDVLASYQASTGRKMSPGEAANILDEISDADHRVKQGEADADDRALLRAAEHSKHINAIYDKLPSFGPGTTRAFIQEMDRRDQMVPIDRLADWDEGAREFRRRTVARTKDPSASPEARAEYDSEESGRADTRSRAFLSATPERSQEPVDLGGGEQAPVDRRKMRGGEKYGSAEEAAARGPRDTIQAMVGDANAGFGDKRLASPEMRDAAQAAGTGGRKPASSILAAADAKKPPPERPEPREGVRLPGAEDLDRLERYRDNLMEQLEDPGNQMTPARRRMWFNRAAALNDQARELRREIEGPKGRELAAQQFDQEFDQEFMQSVTNQGPEHRPPSAPVPPAPNLQPLKPGSEAAAADWLFSQYGSEAGDIQEPRTQGSGRMPPQRQFGTGLDYGAGAPDPWELDNELARPAPDWMQERGRVPPAQSAQADQEFQPAGAPPVPAEQYQLPTEARKSLPVLEPDPVGQLPTPARPGSSLDDILAAIGVRKPDMPQPDLFSNSFGDALQGSTNMVGDIIRQILSPQRAEQPPTPPDQISQQLGKGASGFSEQGSPLDLSQLLGASPRMPTDQGMAPPPQTPGMAPGMGGGLPLPGLPGMPTGPGSPAPLPGMPTGVMDRIAELLGLRKSQPAAPPVDPFEQFLYDRSGGPFAG